MVRTLHRGWPLVLSLALLAAAWSGPLLPLARRSFTAHMTLHILVVSAAAPLMAIGLARLRAGRGGVGFGVGTTLLVAFLDMAVTVVWHAPRLHEAAATDDLALAVQQASFLAASTLVWSAAVRIRDRGGAGIGILLMGMTFAHMSVLGLLLCLAPALIYPPGTCLGLWGMSSLQDQQLGGILMATVGPLPFLIGAVAEGYRLLAAPAGGPLADTS